MEKEEKVKKIILALSLFLFFAGNVWAKNVGVGHGVSIDLPEQWRILTGEEKEFFRPMVDSMLEAKFGEGQNSLKVEPPYQVFLHATQAWVPLVAVVLEEPPKGFLRSRPMRNLITRLQKASPKDLEKERLQFQTIAQSNMSPENYTVHDTVLRPGSIGGNKALFLKHLMTDQNETHELNYYYISFKDRILIISVVGQRPFDDAMITDVQQFMDSITFPQ